MAPRNFGNRNRDMDRAAKNALRGAVSRKEISYETAANYADRFSLFVAYAKENGIRYMEKMDRSLLVGYGRELADQVRDGEMSASYAQNLVSAVNSTIQIASRGKVELGVSPTKDCGIDHRTAVRDVQTVGVERAVHAIQAMRDAGMERQAVVAELALTLGLRSKEASLLNAKAAYEQATERQAVTISDGTKGGRTREVPITDERQLATLKSAADIQGGGRGVMPPEVNWQQWRDGGLKDGRQMLHQHDIRGYHEFRAEYAAQRYESLTGKAAPCNGGAIIERAADRAAREVIAAELGHGRVDVTTYYLGGRG